MKSFLKTFFWRNDEDVRFRIDTSVVANWFDKTQSLVFSEESAHKEELILKKLIATNKDTKILDLGCGNGRYARILLPQIQQYIGVDISKNFILNNKQEIKSHKAEFYHSAAHEFVFPDKFDYILLIGLLTYMNDDEIINMCANCRHMLKDDGKLIVRNVVHRKTKRAFFDDKYFFIKHLFKSPRYQIIRRHENAITEMFNKHYNLIKSKGIPATSYKVYLWELRRDNE